MKKIILAFTLVLFAVASMAQTAPATNPVKTPDPAKVAARQEIKTDMQTVKQDQVALKQAKKSNDATALAAAKQKLQADRATLKTAVKSGKKLGVKPPKGLKKQKPKKGNAHKPKGK